METCSRIILLQFYGNLQSYCTFTMLWKLSCNPSVISFKRYSVELAEAAAEEVKLKPKKISGEERNFRSYETFGNLKTEMIRLEDQIFKSVLFNFVLNF
jgi:hypothetical protein